MQKYQTIISKNLKYNIIYALKNTLTMIILQKIKIKLFKEKIFKKLLFL